ncbi:MAG: hypothetical protein FWC17_07205, partial [Treponema sp.]|nr:hypothetical protein [Treponema sp.]
LCFAVQAYASSDMPDINIFNKSAPVFPHMLFTDTINNWKRAENSRPYWVYTEEEIEIRRQMTSYQVSFLLNNDILAYYGHPASRNMGILGRHSIEELDQLLTAVAAEYEAVSGGKKIRKAFYLIFGTVWPAGEIGIINHDVLMRYIDYGLRHDILIFIDHQIGRYDPIDSLRRMLPYLRYPNVHLALDPEWRTDRPMEVFGVVAADEINRAQQVMEEYIIENNIPGERYLVIHQFNAGMITNRMGIRTNFNRVRLIHCMDGIGSPSMKLSTYAFNAQATNMPIKAFKLFYNLGIPGAGFDNPIMSPRDVYNLNPRPYIIMYQ